MTQSVLTLRKPVIASPRTLGVGLLIIAAALWSLTGLMVKLAAMEPFGFALWRAIGAFAASAMIVPWFRGSRPNARWTMLATLLNALVACTVIWTMSHSTAAKGILLQYTGPIFCALLARLLLGRRLAGWSRLSLMIAGIGIGIMVAAGDGALGGSGTAAGLLCGLAYGGLILVLEKINQSSTAANPFTTVMWMNLGTAGLIAMFSPSSIHADILPGQALLAIGTGVFLTVIPYVLFQIALRQIQAVEASVLVLLEPVLNPVWVALGTGEIPDALTAIGGATTLTAAVIQTTHVAYQQQAAQADTDDEDTSPSQ